MKLGGVHGEQAVSLALCAEANSVLCAIWRSRLDPRSPAAVQVWEAYRVGDTKAAATALARVLAERQARARVSREVTDQ